MTDYEDYENNLAFPPVGDWADTEPKNNTDRTASSIELVNEIEKLNKWLDLKSEYIEKLEKKLDIAKSFIFRCANDIAGDWYVNSAKCVLQQIEELDE